MKVVVLAGGEGKRMMPLTKDRPKVLIEVAGRPFLFWVLEQVRAAGFDEIVVVGCYKIKALRKFVEGYAKETGLKIEVVDQREPLGTGHAVAAALNSIGREQFVVLMGDNLYSASDIRGIARQDNSCYVGGFAAERPELYGNLVINGEKLEKIVEKPKKAVSKLINTGLYKFTPEILEALTTIRKSGRGEFELTDAVTALAARGKANVHILKDFWHDFGKPSDIEKIEGFLRTLKAN